MLDKEHSSLKQQEISRQGSIFRNTRRTIAWFHDIDDFSCLEGLIEIAALSMIGVNKGLREATKHTREWRKARALSHMGDGPTGLFSQPKDTLKGPEFKLWSKQQTGHAKEMSQPVNFWFTSLWTLQELCLRPDMWLATSEWKFLCLEEHTLLPLNGVLCIFGKYKKSLSGERITEPCLIDAVSELRRWEVLTGLGELLSLRRVDILRLGDQRYCKEARSEAIMSVVGATRWYDRVVAGQYDPESDLILNKYCKEFINEVKRLIPTEFYTSYMKHVSIHEDGRMKAINPFTSFDGEGTARDHSASSSACICGSLMPFGKTGQRYRRSPAPGLSNMQAHNSVSSWIIDTLGRVVIKRACMLASRRHAISITRDPLSCNIPNTLTNTNINNFVGKLSISINHKRSNFTNLPDLYKWARTEEFGVYLVGISSLLEIAEYAPGFGVPSSHGLIRGIVLRDVEQEREETRGSRKLASIGTFHAVPQTKTGDRFELPGECSVDWIVL